MQKCYDGVGEVKRRITDKGLYSYGKKTVAMRITMRSLAHCYTSCLGIHLLKQNCSTQKPLL